MTELSEEIFREELPAFRSIVLTVKSNGETRIDAHDMGEHVRNFWGDSDYEFWVNVAGSESQKLIYALLKERFEGKPSAVNDFRDFCIKHQIAHQFDSWI
jgi:hypothetical protein